jgi:hypothetical protein
MTADGASAPSANLTTSTFMRGAMQQVGEVYIIIERCHATGIEVYKIIERCHATGSHVYIIARYHATDR